MDGILRCSRYAFGPNRLHFCGPDANREIWEYVNEGYTDFGLQKLLTQFEALYPYLEHIARENHIEDPFDERVIEAYWLGNRLLDTVDMRMLHRHLAEGLGLKDRLSIPRFRKLEARIQHGLLPNHTFHVLNVPKRMRSTEDADLASMDACRVSWGTVTKVEGPYLTLMREPLVRNGDLLALGPAEEVRVTRRLEADYDIEMLTPGQLVTLHWDVPCEVINQPTVQSLRRYTDAALALANIDMLQ